MTLLKKVLYLLIILLLMLPDSAAADKPAYIIYQKDGRQAAYSEFAAVALTYPVILFGELHNNAVAHWLQLELTRSLASDARPLAVGMEMFEADNQVLIDEYFSGLISQANFEREARLWNNYSTDYKPVLEFARTNGMRLVATNIPRRYASAVHRNGLEVLEQFSTEAKRWMAPLPVTVDTELPMYKAILDMAGGHGTPNLVYAQAVKDATMAWFIHRNLYGGVRFLHLNGSYHSDNYEGINWYLKRLVPEIRILTITTIEADDPADIQTDQLQKADFTIVVASSMTKTY
ncbi:MAG: iron-regulated protein [Balneolaceae bacterium]|nr:MAG: iron-regulated protein [Balneolaceae bacterium]